MKLKLLLLAAAGILFISSCKKDATNNPIFEFNNLKIGAYLTLDSTVNVNFNTTDLSASVGIKVSAAAGVAIDKVNLFVVDDASADQTWKLVKTIDFTGNGTEIAATGSEIAAALGYTAADFLPGNTLTMYNQVVTTDGATYDLNNSGPNVNAPDFNSSFSWTVYIVCPFTGGMAGDYQVLQDDWADYGAGTVLTGAVEDGPGANQITLHVYPNPNYGNPVDPMIVDIDPTTGAATVPKVVYGDYGVPTSAEGSGYVFSCTGFITLTLDHDYGGTLYEGLKLVLQKQ